MRGRTWARQLTFTGILIMGLGLVLALFPFLTNLCWGSRLEYDEGLLVEEPLAPVQTCDYIIDERDYNVDMPYRIVELDTEVPPIFSPEAEIILAIPKLELMFDIGFGVDTSDINQGPSVYPQSTHPELGNLAIAGHRITYGAPFRHLDQLETGDELILSYDNVMYIYQVDKIFATHNRDWSVINDYDAPALTLTTCHPPGWATQRLVVRAYLQ